MTYPYFPGDRVAWKGTPATVVRVARPISAFPEQPSYVIRFDNGFTIRVARSQLDK